MAAANLKPIVRMIDFARLVVLAAAFLPLVAGARILKQHGGSESVAHRQNGIISYPVHGGMAFNGPWQVYRQEGGADVMPEDGHLRYYIENSERMDGWTSVKLDPPLQTDGSTSIFRLRANSMSGEEVKFVFLGNLVMRLMNDGTYCEWGWWTGGYTEKLSECNLRLDGKWHQYVVLTSTAGFTVIEDGKLAFEWEKTMPDYVDQTFHMNVLAEGTSASIDLGDIVAIPGPSNQLT